MKHKKRNEENLMIKLSTFIVDKRNLIFFLLIIGVIFSFFSSGWTEVESSLSEYLPDQSESHQGLKLMDQEFTTYGTAQVMVANVTLAEANQIYAELVEIDGVQSITFDQTKDHYKNGSALYEISFAYSQTDERAMESLDDVKDHLQNYDTYVVTAMGNALADNIEAEVQVIIVLVAIIVVIVLILTSKTYAEVPVLLLTFLSAMLLNQGTNFLLGKISFVSNSVTSVLQLALSLDYAIILVNRFRDERRTLPVRDAIITALSKSIPEISASSLTTIGGLVAMMFMQFKIGADMAICLIKSILFALLSVFTIMPGLLMLFAPWMEKTQHRNFVPKIPWVGKFGYASRHVIPPIFIIVIIVAFFISGNCPYTYGYVGMTPPKLNDTQIAEKMVDDTFGTTNFVAIVVPKDDYEVEQALLKELETYDEVDFTMGLSNIPAMDGYTLADKLTPRQFAELADLDYEVAQIVYSAYAIGQADYTEIISNISSYGVPLIDMMLFVCDQIDSGLVSLDGDMMEMLASAKVQMQAAKAQLQGENYNRMLVYLTLPESGEETYEFLDTMRELVRKHYPEGDIYVVGDSSVEQDFKISYSRDNLIVTIVSILIVLAVLLFTFKSVAMPLLLIIVIQGAIWINFSVPALTNNGIFFMSYLVVSAIQMGANIDYAIVIASRFQELKNEMSHKDAIIETMNFAFPTILTSGSIMVIAGTLIGSMTSDISIVGIGESLGRGTIISILLVMFVLPQILLVGNKFVEKTAFAVGPGIKKQGGSGHIKVDGLVRGEVHGFISGVLRADIDGDVDLNILSGPGVVEGGAENEE